MPFLSNRSLTFSQRCAIGLINTYRAASPLLRSIQKTAFGHVPECTYSPTCGEYTIRSVKKYGTMRGLLLGVKRIFTCW